MSLCINILNALHTLLVHQINRRTLQFTDVDTYLRKAMYLALDFTANVCTENFNLGLTVKSFSHDAMEDT